MVRLNCICSAILAPPVFGFPCVSQMVFIALKLRRARVLELPRGDDDRQHWLTHRGLGKKCMEKCSRCDFAEAKSGILQCAELSLVPGLATAGTWLESIEDQHGSWNLRCVLCNKYLSENRPRQLRRHGQSLQHKRLIQNSNLLACAQDGFRAPSAENFQALLDHVRKSPLGQDVELEQNVGSRHKQRKMLWCLAEASRIVQREFLMQCKSMAVYQDARKTFLLDRWSASDAKLNYRFGHLWGTKLLDCHSLDASGLQQATLDGLRNMCTARMAPPQLSVGQARWTGGVLNLELLDHLRQIIEVFAADSASDEISAAHMIQRKGLIPTLQHMGLPNLRHVVRDKAHCSRRTFDS